MADFRRWLTALAVPLVFAGLASAQVIGGGSTPLTCNVNTSSTPILRSEGITEQVGDIVITCSGGNLFLNNGSGGTSNPLAPATNITVSLTSQVTSRLLGGSGLSEALLLIDEPNSGLTGPVPGFGPNQPFTPCSTPTTGGCAGSTSPTPGFVLTQTVSGTGYQTTVTSSTATQGNAVPAQNVYQGVVSGNQVTFFGVPVTPPGTTGQRVFRITNVRVNASGIGGGTASGSLPVQASIAISNFSALPISNPTPLVGFVQTSLSTSVAAPTGFGQCNSQTLQQSTILTYGELFASAFKTRVDPSVAGQSAPSGQTKGQGSALVQDVPGTVYFSESGFTLQLPTVAAVSGSNAAPAGLADAGTRFTGVFNNIPAGARVFVSQFTVSVNAFGVATADVSSGNSWAQLVSGENVPDGSGGAPVVPPFATGTAPGGTGGIHVVEITPTSGSTATATWESMANQPTAIDTYQFAVFITYVASPGTNTPAAGTGTVNLRYGPSSTVTTAASGPVPRFIDTSSAKNAISIGICRTILLWPFVTNIPGFDTGLAIANTSTDPFGTTPQAGTCQLNWFGSGGSTTPFTTPSIASGTVYAAAVGASNLNPGFQGYVIGICGFQYAHGYAAVTDTGLRNLLSSYLAEIIPDPNLNGGVRKANTNATSNANSGEQLAH